MKSSSAFWKHCCVLLLRSSPSPCDPCLDCFRSAVSGPAASSLAFSSLRSQRSSQSISASAPHTLVVLQGAQIKSQRLSGALRSPFFYLPDPTSCYHLPCIPHIRQATLLSQGLCTSWSLCLELSFPRCPHDFLSRRLSGLCSYINFSVKLSLTTLFKI